VDRGEEDARAEVPHRGRVARERREAAVSAPDWYSRGADGGLLARAPRLGGEEPALAVGDRRGRDQPEPEGAHAPGVEEEDREAEARRALAPHPGGDVGLGLAVRQQAQGADLGGERREEERRARVPAPRGREVREQEGVEGVEVLPSASPGGTHAGVEGAAERLGQLAREGARAGVRRRVRAGREQRGDERGRGVRGLECSALA
jgi:hypothetical protein